MYGFIAVFIMEIFTIRSIINSIHNSILKSKILQTTFMKLHLSSKINR
jgi:hypothetical protein